MDALLLDLKCVCIPSTYTHVNPVPSFFYIHSSSWTGQLRTFSYCRSTQISILNTFSSTFIYAKGKEMKECKKQLLWIAAYLGERWSRKTKLATHSHTKKFSEDWKKKQKFIETLIKSKPVLMHCTIWMLFLHIKY